MNPVNPSIIAAGEMKKVICENSISDVFVCPELLRSTWSKYKIIFNEDNDKKKCIPVKILDL